MSDRTEAVKYLEALFRKVNLETYYQKNTNKKIKYPYQTFSLTGEPTRKNGKGFYVDVSLFDDNKQQSDATIENALSAMIEAFDEFHELTDKFLVQLEYRSDNPIPTGSDSLLRRELQLYAKIDWRK